MGKLSIELRDETNDFVTAQAKKRGITKSEVVRKALNVLSTLDDENIDVILRDGSTGENIQLLIA